MTAGVALLCDAGLATCAALCGGGVEAVRILLLIACVPEEPAEAGAAIAAWPATVAGDRAGDEAVLVMSCAAHDCPGAAGTMGIEVQGFVSHRVSIAASKPLSCAFTGVSGSVVIHCRCVEHCEGGGCVLGSIVVVVEVGLGVNHASNRCSVDWVCTSGAWPSAVVCTEQGVPGKD